MRPPPYLAARLWAEWLMIAFGGRPGRKILPGDFGKSRFLPPDLGASKTLTD
jgi:hypothetical protein